MKVVLVFSFGTWLFNSNIYVKESIGENHLEKVGKKCSNIFPPDTKALYKLKQCGIGM